MKGRKSTTAKARCFDLRLFQQWLNSTLLLDPVKNAQAQRPGSNNLTVEPALSEQTMLAYSAIVHDNGQTTVQHLSNERSYYENVYIRK